MSEFQTYQATDTDDYSSQDVPWLYVLTVLVSSGGFARQKVIATAFKKEDLTPFLERWVGRNRNTFAGKYSIDHVPFVSEVEDA